MKQNIYRCTFTNEVDRVGDKIDSFKFESLPDYLKGDYKKATVKDSEGKRNKNS